MVAWMDLSRAVEEAPFPDARRPQDSQHEPAPRDFSARTPNPWPDRPLLAENATRTSDRDAPITPVSRGPSPAVSLAVSSCVSLRRTSNPTERWIAAVRRSQLPLSCARSSSPSVSLAVSIAVLPVRHAGTRMSSIHQPSARSLVFASDPGAEHIRYSMTTFVTGGGATKGTLATPPGSGSRRPLLPLEQRARKYRTARLSCRSPPVCCARSSSPPVSRAVSGRCIACPPYRDSKVIDPPAGPFPPMHRRSVTLA